jgi:hypothetical protein
MTWSSNARPTPDPSIAAAVPAARPSGTTVERGPSPPDSIAEVVTDAASRSTEVLEGPADAQVQPRFKPATRVPWARAAPGKSSTAAPGGEPAKPAAASTAFVPPVRNPGF